MSLARDPHGLELLNIAAEANMLTHVSWLQSRIPGMSVHSDPQLTVIDSGLASDSFNLVCRARLEDAAVPERIAGVIEHFRSVARPFSWWVGPADRPVDLGTRLLRAGFTAADGELAMAADLETIRHDDSVPAGLHVERVSSAVQLQEFADVIAANWTPPDSVVTSFYESASALLLTNDCPLCLYLGYHRDEVVAAAEITLSGSVAGVYNVSTRLARRRNGFGTAVMLRALQDARAEGYNTAVLQAARGAEGLYTRIGFVPIGEFVEYKT